MLKKKLRFIVRLTFCQELCVLCPFTLDVQLPFGVIFGGTDLNEDVKVEQKRVVMEQVLQRAR